MPHEIFVIALASIIAGTLMIASIVGSIFKFLREKEKHRKESSASSSLTTGELQRLMQAAVENAIAPLHDRIDALERRLSAPASSHRGTPLIDENLLDADDEATQEPAFRRRSHSSTR